MNRRVLGLVAAVAAASVGLLAMAVHGHWLGPDVDRGADFCEIASGLIRQPSNTISNAGFVIAGLLIAARVNDRSRIGLRLGTSYAVVVVLLGPASAAMHATESVVSGHLDMASMYLVGGFAAAYALMRATGRGPGFFAATYGACLAVGVLAEFGGRSVPVVMSWGNAWFGLLLLVTLVVEIRLARATQALHGATEPPHGTTQRSHGTTEPSQGATRRSYGASERGGDTRWAWAAGGSLLIAFVIWNVSKNGGPLCDPHSWIQGHAIWHLLCAVAAYCLFRLYDSEQAPTATPITRDQRARTTLPSSHTGSSDS